MNRPADAGEANRLYWESDESVADIAARLDMSRRALYDAIEPLPTGASCEICGGPMTFENRSARTAGQATCAVCAATGSTTADRPDRADRAGGARPAARAERPERAERSPGAARAAGNGEEAELSPEASLERLLEERTVMVGGAALAGAAIGALVTFMLVSRR